MLARKYHLTKKGDFDLVKTKGKTFKSESFILRFYKRGDSEPSRFGFIFSKKVHPNASLRNKAKRALSEGLRQCIFEIKDGYDCVFVAMPIVVKKYTVDLMNEVKNALFNAGLSK